MNYSPISSEARIGHVHLRVADLDRAIAFYRDVLGFTLRAYGPDFGFPAAFMAFGDYHHHLGLNTFVSQGCTAPPKGHTGLHHFAILYSDRHALAAVVKHLFDYPYPIDGAEDHGGTISVYLRDPDGNGIELYYDRPVEQWVDELGNLILKSEPIDPRKLVDSVV